MTKAFAVMMALMAGLGLSPASAGIPLAGIAGPQCLCLLRPRRIRAVAAELPRDTVTAEQFFDSTLRAAWMAVKSEPYDFLVQSPNWNIGAVTISILRKQFDKTYVAVAFTNNGRAVDAEFHCHQWTRRLGDPGCREPARFTADVSGAVQELNAVARPLLPLPVLHGERVGVRGCLNDWTC